MLSRFRFIGASSLCVDRVEAHTCIQQFRVDRLLALVPKKDWLDFNYLLVNHGRAICIARKPEAEIEKLVASHFRAIWYDMREGNAELGRWIRQFRGRLYGYVGIHSPAYGQLAIDEIDRGLHDYGMVGVKVYTSEQFPLCDPQMKEIIAHVADLGVPLLAHTSPQRAEPVMCEIPNVKLILAHMGNTFDPGSGAWQWAISLAKKYANVYLETCSSSPTLGFIEAAVEAIGPAEMI